MAETTESTKYVCLFHHRGQAEGALRDLEAAGIAPGAISVIGNADNSAQTSTATAQSLRSSGVPEADLDRLQRGVIDGGVIVIVEGYAEQEKSIEKIFHEHAASKIDEAAREMASVPVADNAANIDSGVIPVVNEELVVGKREVERGGVRVFRRVVEEPVTESVQLREERVRLDRRPVDRAVTDADLNAGDRTIDLIETAEEAVVGKTSRVVEEVHVGKQVTEHTERVNDTVRHTEVEIEEIDPATGLRRSTR